MVAQNYARAADYGDVQPETWDEVFDGGRCQRAPTYLLPAAYRPACRPGFQLAGRRADGALEAEWVADRSVRARAPCGQRLYGVARGSHQA